jgi:hypothetical protein
LTRKYLRGLQVVIAAHDRPAETLRAIRALEKVDFGPDVNFVLSDNPTDAESRVIGAPPEFEYRLRQPCLSAEAHFATILDELEFEWTVITHDDDEILPALGKLFNEYSKDVSVGVITGKSRIVDKNLKEIFYSGYIKRLDDSGLTAGSEKIRSDLFDYLFDLGTLFPASAIIFRTELLGSIPEWEETPNLAGDLLLSMHLAKNSSVAFESNEPVMNYHAHGGNSVLSPEAAGGLQADMTTTRLQLLIEHPEIINANRKSMLTKSAIMARVLTKAFDFKDRYQRVNSMIRAANVVNNQRVVFWFASTPIFLGPLKPLVRYLMWKRLGIKSFAKK